MADRPPLKSFTFGGCYKDDPEESGPRTDIVLAPDRETAIRLAAAEILTDNEWTLEGQGYDTLEEFHDGEIIINDEWVEGNSPNACPVCTSSTVSLIADGEGYECRTCGAGFTMHDHTPARASLEAQAWSDIDDLEDFERKSRGEGCKSCEEAIETRLLPCDECGEIDG